MKAHSHPSVGCRALAGLQAEADCSHLPELPEQPHHHQMQPTPVSHYIHPSRGDSHDGFPCLTPMLGGALLEYLPAGQGHRVNAKSRLSNSPQPPTRLSRERSRWKTRDRKYFLNFSMGSSLQNVSKRRLKGGGIRPPKYAAALVERSFSAGVPWKTADAERGFLRERLSLNSPYWPNGTECHKSLPRESLQPGEADCCHGWETRGQRHIQTNIVTDYHISHLFFKRPIHLS